MPMPLLSILAADFHFKGRVAQLLLLPELMAQVSVRTLMKFLKLTSQSRAELSMLMPVLMARLLVQVQALKWGR